MRILCALIASLLMTPVLGCTTVDPDECWVNTSGGFGGSGPFPTGAGVGATSSGDYYITPPPGGPLAAEATENPCVEMGSITFVNFSPSEFPFVTIVPDDGMGPAGGWQEAKANLEFIKRRPGGGRTWTCGLTIGMPIRPAAYGTISPSRAAMMSVDVTEDVAYAMGSQYDLPQGIFCDRFRTGVDVTFKSKYPDLGSSVRL